MNSPMSTPNRMQSHWESVREFIRKEWPKISAAQLLKINGDFDLFLKYLRDSYPNFPLEEAQARDKIQKYINKLENV